MDEVSSGYGCNRGASHHFAQSGIIAEFHQGIFVIGGLKIIFHVCLKIIKKPGVIAQINIIGSGSLYGNIGLNIFQIVRKVRFFSLDADKEVERGILCCPFPEKRVKALSAALGNQHDGKEQGDGSHQNADGSQLGGQRAENEQGMSAVFLRRSFLEVSRNAGSEA